MMNNDDNWSDAECRYFIKLCTDEKKKGNKTKTGLNPTGKDSIIRKFEDRFGKRFVWDKFKNKYDVCRRAYQKFKNLIHNRTGVGYDAMGRIDMSDDWWNERFKEWPGARKYKNKLIPNMDVFEDEFGAIHVSGAEGWSAQQGENSLDSRVGVENEDEVNSFDVVAPTPVVGTQNRASSSGLKRKRKEVDTTSTTDTRNVILNRKNDLVAQMLEREDSFSVMRVLEILNELPEMRLWSPFHSASVLHLQADVTHRQAFITFPNAKDRISYLELRTGVKFDD